MMLGHESNGITITSNQDELRMIREVFHAITDEVIDKSFEIMGAVVVIDSTGQTIDHHSLGMASEKWSDFLKDISWTEASIGANALVSSTKTLKPEQAQHKDHTSTMLQAFNSFATPIHSKVGELQIILGLLVSKQTDAQASIQIMNSIAYAFNIALKYSTESKASRESQMREVLYHSVKSLHSKIDVNSVLTEAVDSLKLIYPAVTIDLFLSQDNQSTKLPVKPLVLDGSDQDLSARAFMAGTIQTGIDVNGNHLVAAPLSGKQGVYGVFQLIFEDGGYSEVDLEFTSMLADSAGSAFENAKLYEQSNLLISELRLINEITRRLNQSLKLKDIFTFASKELIDIFDANYGCVLKLDNEKECFKVEASNLPTFANEVISIDYGFSGIVYRTKEPLIISDYSQKSNVESRLMVETNSRSLIATPIMVNSSVVGAILVTHRESNYFTYENYKLLQVISVHIGLAIANASLHAEVRRMVITDNLTGLYARSYLDEQVAILQKKDYCGALILIDLDDFKKVNDTYGHQVGDEVLIQVASIIKSSIRDTDIAARWGGEELAIYLPLSKLEHTQKVAERIRLTILNETKPQVSISSGISLWTWEDDTISVESLFYRADMALYKAKKEGRNKTIVG